MFLLGLVDVEVGLAVCMFLNPHVATRVERVTFQSGAVAEASPFFLKEDMPDLRMADEVW